MKRLALGLVLTGMVVTGCANRNITVPGGPAPGFSGTDSTVSGFQSAGISGTTLPGTNISDTVLFEVDQNSLNTTAIGILNAQAGWLSQNPGVTVLIAGHADERGTGEYNMALGSSRASSVRNYFVSQGISDTRISITTYGRERPVATCANDSCYSRNRRAVTVVTGAVGS